MSVDTTTIGQVTAELMDTIDRDYPDDDVTVRTVIVVAELHTPESTFVMYRCSDERTWIQRGLLAEALEASRRPADDDE